MARGSAANEPIVSQAATPEYRAAHERIFGDRPPQRGAWVVHPKTGNLIPVSEYVAEEAKEARYAPIISDRLHEGTISPIDGSDIGSRRKRRDHMKAYGVADKDDFKQYRQDYPAMKERERDQSVKRDMDRAARKLYREGKLR